MEHSSLHALQLIGLILALSGPFLALVLLPAGADSPLRPVFAAGTARWTANGALLAVGAGLVDLLVQVDEVRGRSVFEGFDLSLTWKFATQTVVGQLSVCRIGLLALAAIAARKNILSLAGLFAVGALACTAMVSHAAAQPVGRAPAITAQVLHIASAAAWLGVLGHILLSRPAIEASTSPADARLIAGLIRRFSPVALGVAALLLCSGVYAVFHYLGSPTAMLTSAYGLTLLVKLGLLVPLLVAAWVNFRVIRPGLLAFASDGAGAAGFGPVLRRFGRMLELEVTAGILVVTVAGVVGSVPPPGEAGAYRLTPVQTRALLQPDLPTTAVDRAALHGPEERTVDDMRYAEFMHNWSGVVVILLGLGWLMQSAGGRAIAKFAGRAWPFLLAPFAVFISVASDPEVWLLRRVGFWQALRDPQVLEHQLSAMLVLFLVVLGWRDRKRDRATRPLGYALPVILIAGSLLLLGHAHSTLTITEDLTNLINVQHAIFGMFGLYAGTVRWLQLRGLFPQRAARVIWPGLVVGLGLFMTFFYREVV